MVVAKGNVTRRRWPSEAVHTFVGRLTMSMSGSGQFRLLRGFLCFAALVWGVSVCGVFSTWDAAASALSGMGAQPISYDRMLDYWLRMVSGAFALIGLGYSLLAINPRKHAAILPWAGWLMIVEGAVLAFHGFRLNLPTFPFYGDIAACFIGGVGILASRKSAAPLQPEE